MSSQDRWRDDEDAAMRAGLTSDLDMCEQLGVQDEFICEWALGVRLTGSENVARFNQHDYSSITLNAHKAGEEYDRLAAKRKKIIGIR